MEQSDDAFDLITLICALVIFTPIMVFVMVPFLNGHVGGFDVQIDKTARVTNAEIIPVHRQLKANDVVLMLAVADRYGPDPNKIRLSVNGSIEIKIDEDFFVNKAEKVIEAKTAMPVNENVKLQLFSDQLGMRFWDVQPE
ncbi:hypothetical protein [Cohnella mopanensis]|uniref:hypothetical protein n=1 Tax=Cohnella mopanensis TaxID=2911966 RepID=UPI001EF8FBB3|nr:hypothetical protein [Cohnella mopanensis]